MIPGDIIIWRSHTLHQGHVAIVVSDGSSYVVENNIAGITNVIAFDEDLNDYGQNQYYTFNSQHGPIDIAWYDFDKKEVIYANKIVVTGKNKRPRYIFGDPPVSNLSCFIGDSRLTALGFELLDKNNSDFIYQYKFFDDENIFFNFDNLPIAGNQYSNQLTELKKAVERKSFFTYFWTGADDLYTYKNKFTIVD